MNRFQTVTVYSTDGTMRVFACSYGRTYEGVLYVRDTDDRGDSTMFPLVNVNRWTVAE
jgi:hypothetical protein